MRDMNLKIQVNEYVSIFQQAELLEAMEVKKKRMQDEIAFDRMFQEAIDAQYKREQEELAAKVVSIVIQQYIFFNRFVLF